MIVRIEGGGNLAEILSRDSEREEEEIELIGVEGDEPTHPVKSWIDKANWRHSRSKGEMNLAASN